MEIRKATQLKEKPKDESKLGFGQIFTDHMFIMEYSQGEGWKNPQIKPYENFSISPASTVLHYGQEVFEGLKAYRNVSGGVNLFRPKDNFKRMSVSAKRLAMPEFNEELAMEGLLELLKLEQDWVPSKKGTSLYIRPNFIGVDRFLGVRASRDYLFYIMVGPVGEYYANGLAPTKILVETDYVRSAKGGLGFAKTAANYAASLIASEEAKEKGCDQVLWLDAKDHKYIEEVGSMNMMFVIDGKLVTPNLNGTILPGVTRDSVLVLAKDMGMAVEERQISVDEVISKAKTGELSEAFGTGTAAVISPVGEFVYKDEVIQVAGNKMGKYAQIFFDTLTKIQYMEIEDKFNWILEL